MQYTVRASINGRDARLDETCRVFSSMERASYNVLREGVKPSDIKHILRDRYGIKNARWLQSAINQAGAVMDSQEKGIRLRIELYEEKVRNTREKMHHLHSPLKISGCEVKVTNLQRKIKELKEQLHDGSYPMAVFGSKNMFHKFSFAKGQSLAALKKRWRENRSNHFFSVGQANQKGNGNARLLYDEEGFYLEIRNWFPDDFKVKLKVPEYAREVVKKVIDKATSVKLGRSGEVIDGGLAYSSRVIRSMKGYEVLASFEVEEPLVEWKGRIAGIDINPEGMACTVVSRDGNLLATRFFKDNRLITASRNKRKWVLENLVNRMLRWCLLTHSCNAVAIEKLALKGAYDYAPATNFKLANFMRRRMLDVIKLHALKMVVLCVGVNPAYSSMVAIAKYGKQFGGFNRHHLAAFVIARRVLGYGETPVLSRLPKTRKERNMWNHCIRYFGYQPQLQTLLRHEPMEWKSGGDGNGGGMVTELLRARPTNTSARGLGHDAPMTNRTGAVQIIASSGRQVGSVHPNRHAIGGDGATGHRVNPADKARPLAVVFHDKEDNVIR